MSAAPAIAPSADARNRSREGVFLRRDSMIAAHDGLISRSRSFAPDRHDTPSAQYAAMEGGPLCKHMRAAAVRCTRRFQAFMSLLWGQATRPPYSMTG